MASLVKTNSNFKSLSNDIKDIDKKGNNDMDDDQGGDNQSRKEEKGENPSGGGKRGDNSEVSKKRENLDEGNGIGVSAVGNDELQNNQNRPNEKEDTCFSEEENENGYNNPLTLQPETQTQTKSEPVSQLPKSNNGSNLEENMESFELCPELSINTFSSDGHLFSGTGTEFETESSTESCMEDHGFTELVRFSSGDESFVVIRNEEEELSTGYRSLSMLQHNVPPISSSGHVTMDTNCPNVQQNQTQIERETSDGVKNDEVASVSPSNQAEEDAGDGDSERGDGERKDTKQYVCEEGASVSPGNQAEKNTEDGDAERGDGERKDTNQDVCEEGASVSPGNQAEEDAGDGDEAGENKEKEGRSQEPSDQGETDREHGEPEETRYAKVTRDKDENVEETVQALTEVDLNNKQTKNRLEEEGGNKNKFEDINEEIEGQGIDEEVKGQDDIERKFEEDKALHVGDADSNNGSQKQNVNTDSNTTSPEPLKTKCDSGAVKNDKAITGDVSKDGEGNLSKPFAEDKNEVKTIRYQENEGPQTGAELSGGQVSFLAQNSGRQSNDNVTMVASASSSEAGSAVGSVQGFLGHGNDMSNEQMSEESSPKDSMITSSEDFSFLNSSLSTIGESTDTDSVSTIAASIDSQHAKAVPNEMMRRASVSLPKNLSECQNPQQELNNLSVISNETTDGNDFPSNLRLSNRWMSTPEGLGGYNISSNFSVDSKTSNVEELLKNGQIDKNEVVKSHRKEVHVELPNGIVLRSAKYLCRHRDMKSKLHSLVNLGQIVDCYVEKNTLVTTIEYEGEYAINMEQPEEMIRMFIAQESKAITQISLSMNDEICSEIQQRFRDTIDVYCPQDLQDCSEAEGMQQPPYPFVLVGQVHVYQCVLFLLNNAEEPELELAVSANNWHKYHAFAFYLSEKVLGILVEFDLILKHEKNFGLLKIYTTNSKLERNVLIVGKSFDKFKECFEADWQLKSDWLSNQGIHHATYELLFDWCPKEPGALANFLLKKIKENVKDTGPIYLHVVKDIPVSLDVYCKDFHYQNRMRKCMYEIAGQKIQYDILGRPSVDRTRKLMNTLDILLCLGENFMWAVGSEDSLNELNKIWKDELRKTKSKPTCQNIPIDGNIWEYLKEYCNIDQLASSYDVSMEYDNQSSALAASGILQQVQQFVIELKITMGTIQTAHFYLQIKVLRQSVTPSQEKILRMITALISNYCCILEAYCESKKEESDATGTTAGVFIGLTSTDNKSIIDNFESQKGVVFCVDISRAEFEQKTVYKSRIPGFITEKEIEKSQTAVVSAPGADADNNEEEEDGDDAADNDEENVGDATTAAAADHDNEEEEEDGDDDDDEEESDDDEEGEEPMSCDEDHDNSENRYEENENISRPAKFFLVAKPVKTDSFEEELSKYMSTCQYAFVVLDETASSALIGCAQMQDAKHIMESAITNIEFELSSMKEVNDVTIDMKKIFSNQNEYETLRDKLRSQVEQMLNVFIMDETNFQWKVSHVPFPNIFVLEIMKMWKNEIAMTHASLTTDSKQLTQLSKDGQKGDKSVEHKKGGVKETEKGYQSMNNGHEETKHRNLGQHRDVSGKAILPVEAAAKNSESVAILKNVRCIHGIQYGVFQAFMHFMKDYPKNMKDDIDKKIQYDNGKVFLNIDDEHVAAMYHKELADFSKEVAYDLIWVKEMNLSVNNVTTALDSLRKHYDNCVYFHFEMDFQTGMVGIVILLGRDEKAVREAKAEAKKVLVSQVKPKFSFWNQLGSIFSSSSDEQQQQQGTAIESGLTRNKVHKNFCGIDVFVYMGDILSLQVDCIVNPANKNLRHDGALAKKISEKAGISFQADSYKYVQNYGPLNVGDVACTTAGKLPFGVVLHAIGPVWGEYKGTEFEKREKCSKDLCKTVLKCIQRADKENMQSIALPAISSGVFRVPFDVCVTSYLKGILTACAELSDKPQRSLKEIHFVDINVEMVWRVQQEIFTLEAKSIAPNVSMKTKQDNYNNKWSNSLQDFLPYSSEIKENVQQPKKRNGKKKGNPQAANKNTGHKVKVGMAFHLKETYQILVKTGDILAEKADVLVCGQDKDLESHGKIAKTIWSKAKNSYKKQINQIKQNNPNRNMGDVLVCQLKSVAASVVMFAITPNWECDRSDPKACQRGIKQCVTNVLTESSKQGYTSIVFPLLGTGTHKPHQEKFDLSTTVTLMLERIIQYFQDAGPNCSIKKVYMINKDVVTTDTVCNILQDDVNHKQREVLKARDEHAGLKGRNNSPGGDGTENVENIIMEMPNECPVCLETVDDRNNSFTLDCGHTYHETCKNDMFKQFKPVCCMCQRAYDVVKGNQPPGTMTVMVDRQKCIPNCKNMGVITIVYDIPKGTQNEHHPNPGFMYDETRRTAYLPYNDEGILVCKMLMVAFERRLVFTIGRSNTTNQENCVVWNDIHHKTSIPGGPGKFGYPDDSYLSRVREELESKYIREEDTINIKYIECEIKS